MAHVFVSSEVITFLYNERFFIGSLSSVERKAL